MPDTLEEIVEMMARAAFRAHWPYPVLTFEGLSAETQASYRDEMRAILAALEANGLVVVPREPTEEMLYAARHCWPRDFFSADIRENAHSAWALMVVSRPRLGLSHTRDPYTAEPPKEDPPSS